MKKVSLLITLIDGSRYDHLSYQTLKKYHLFVEELMAKLDYFKRLQRFIIASYNTSLEDYMSHSRAMEIKHKLDSLDNEDIQFVNANFMTEYEISVMFIDVEIAELDKKEIYKYLLGKN